jgi:hypothetical protein
MILAFVFSVYLGLAPGGVVRADLIPVSKAFPDIECAYVSGSYVAGTRTFTATGWPTSYSINSGSQVDVLDGGDGWSFAINMTLPSATTTPMDISSGTVAIYGQVGSQSGALLTGNIEKFGSSIAPSLVPNTTLFDFRFLVTGGKLAGDFGGANVGHAGIILSPVFDVDSGDVAFTGGFASSFEFLATGAGTADVFLVPEPSAALILASMAAGLVSITARRSWTRRGFGPRKG